MLAFFSVWSQGGFETYTGCTKFFKKLNNKQNVLQLQMRAKGGAYSTDCYHILSEGCIIVSFQF